MNHILTNIQSLRSSKGFSEKQMAENLKINQKEYAALEKGKSEMSLQMLEKIASILGIETAYLLQEPHLLPLTQDLKRMELMHSELTQSQKGHKTLLEENSRLKKENETLRSKNIEMSEKLNKIYENVITGLQDTKLDDSVKKFLNKLFDKI